MSTFMRKIVFCILGMAAGLTAWSLAELVLIFQKFFPSYLVFTISLGAVFGGIMGAFLGTSEGITLSASHKIIKGLVLGFILGTIGGAVGFLAGQFILLISGEYLIHSGKGLREFGIPVSRSIGWSLVGIFIGAVEGIRAASWRKIKVGIIGGFIGGLLGGIVLEYSRLFFTDLMYSRLLGLIILGLLIGFCYSLVEKSFSRAVLKSLNGKFKGKEFLLVQDKIKLGSSSKADIQLTEYQGIDEEHIELQFKENEIITRVSTPENKMLVNDDQVKEHRLRFEDVIQIGTAKFLFFYK